jgi:hypothetical protein
MAIPSKNGAALSPQIGLFASLKIAKRGKN